MAYDILIVGGGIIGVASAYFLGKRGYHVLVLEQLTSFGALTTASSLAAIRAQFATAANIALTNESITFYEQFSEELELDKHDIGLRQQGYLFVTSEEDQVEKLRSRVRFQHNHGLMDVEFLDADEIKGRFPFLAGNALAATYRQRDGWLSAHEVVLGFRKAASRYDVHFRTAARVHKLLAQNGRITGVALEDGNIAASAVVLAAGPFTSTLAQTVGIELPLAAIRRHRLVIGEHELIPGWAPMTVDQDTGAHWRPEGPGAALAWAEPEPPMPPGLHITPDPHFSYRVLEGVSHLSPFWLDVAESLQRNQVFLHAGQYTETPDHDPLIGLCPDSENLWVITGFSGHGVMSTPAACRLLADLIEHPQSKTNNPYRLLRPSLTAPSAAETMIL